MSSLAKNSDATTYEEYTEEYNCKYCNSNRAKRIIGLHPGGHYARIQCVSCDRFIKWEGKPREKSDRRKGQKKLLDKYSKGFCEICLRKGTEIPLPQVLEVHHVVPVEDGGTDDRTNLQIVCTACHKWIHHQRTYLGHYRQSIPQSQVDRRYAVYAEIIQVMEERGIEKRSAINILKEQFNAQTRDDLDDEQLVQFLEILKSHQAGEVA